MHLLKLASLLSGILLMTDYANLTPLSKSLGVNSNQDTIDVEMGPELDLMRAVVKSENDRRKTNSLPVGGGAAASRNDISAAIGDRTRESAALFVRNSMQLPRGAAPLSVSTVPSTVQSSMRRPADVTPSPAPRHGKSSPKNEGAGCPRYSDNATPSDDDDGRKLTDEEFRCMHLEEIKVQILRKLRMVNRPNTTIPRSMLPAPLTEGGFTQFTQSTPINRDIDDFYGKTEQVIVMAEKAEYPTCYTDHHDPAACFFFNLSDDVVGRHISSAEVWAYKLRDKRDSHNQTYLVTDIVKETMSSARRHNVVSIRETSFKDGWIKFDITATVRRWKMKSNSKEHGLEISCKTCVMGLDELPVSNDPGERPFLVINLNTQATLRRSRRNLSCTANTTQCCKETLYVSFTDIGWNDWIIQPSGYMANYCRGSCVEDVTNNRNHHTTVIQQLLIQNKINLTQSQQKELAPCCTPTRMSSINLLYTDGSGRIIINTLPNMVVEACACY